MSKRVKVMILVAALLILGALALSRFWPLESEPVDLETYLQRELARLQGEDAEDLPDSEQRIKLALGENATTDHLVRAYVVEHARCHADAHHHWRVKIPVRSISEQGNGWKDFVAAADSATAAERALDYWAYSKFSESGRVDEQTAPELLRGTAETSALLNRALEADFITTPGKGFDFSVSAPTTTARVMTLRVAALLQSGSREAAIREATLALRAFSKLDLGASALTELVGVIHWGILIGDMLMKLDWSADELESLIREVILAPLRLDAYMLAEARAGVESWDTPAENPVPAAGEEFESVVARAGLQDMVNTHGYLPIGELIDIDVAVLEELIAARLAVADWASKNPGDVLDPKYYAQVKNRMSPRETIIVSGLRNSSQPLAMLAAARLRAVWLRGKRGTALDAEANNIARDSRFFVVSQEAGQFAFQLAPEHPLISGMLTGQQPTAVFKPPAK